MPSTATSWKRIVLSRIKAKGDLNAGNIKREDGKTIVIMAEPIIEQCNAFIKK